MRLALDATYALDPHPSGVARYSDQLARELESAPDMHLTLCARWPRVLRLRRHFSSLRFSSCLLQEPLNVMLPRRVDMFHGLNQRLPRYRFRRQVVTVHDVFPLSDADYSTPEFRRRFSEVIRDAVRRADRIICVSAYTRDRLCETLGVQASRCDVIYHGIDHVRTPPVRARRMARELAGSSRFLLCVGAIQVRKNTLAAVQAIAQIPAKQDVRLVIAGSAGHGAEAVTDFIRQHALHERVKLAGWVSDDLLHGLYAEAAGLLFPSIEEGFGFPVLEAMARGLPVIASDTASIPEIAGDAAILVDPRNTGTMAQQALRLVEDTAWRDEYIARGYARAGLFTWKRTAEQTLETYRKTMA